MSEAGGWKYVTMYLDKPIVLTFLLKIHRITNISVEFSGYVGQKVIDKRVIILILNYFPPVRNKPSVLPKFGEACY